MANNTGKKFGGRQKGSLNKVTSTLKDKIQEIVNRELENIDELLSELEPKDRLDSLIKLLPYVLPKQQEVVKNTEYISEIVLTDATKH